MRDRLPLLFLTAAGACWILGQAVLPDMGLESTERFANVVAARGEETTATILLILAGLLLVLAAVSLSRVATERGITAGRGGSAVRVGTAMLALGGVWLVAGRGAFNMMFLRATHPDVSDAAGRSVFEAPVGPEFAVLLPTLLCLLLGPVVLAIGLWRSGRVAWPGLALWVVGIALFVVTEFTSKAGEIAGVGLASAGLVAIGVLVTADRRAVATPPSPAAV